MALFGLEAVSRGRGQNLASMLARQDQGGILLLQAEVLRLAIEDLPEAFAFDMGQIRVARKNRPCARMIARFGFDIDG